MDVPERNAIAKTTFLWPGTAAIFTILAHQIALALPTISYGEWGSAGVLW
jgi:hypothetical protein